MSTYYLTEYTMKNGNSGRYRTNSLTPHHERIRKASVSAKTMKCDPSVPWPFGVWAEVIARESGTEKGEKR
jgi:hypothetical protein